MTEDLKWAHQRWSRFEEEPRDRKPHDPLWRPLEDSGWKIKKKTAALAEFQEPLRFCLQVEGFELITPTDHRGTIQSTQARPWWRCPHVEVIFAETLPQSCSRAGVICLREQLDFFSPTTKYTISSLPIPPAPGAAQRLFMIPRDNLRVSGLRAEGPHFRPSVSPDRSLRYQITKLLKLYGTHRFFFSIFFLPFCPTQPVWTYLRWSRGFLVLIKSQNLRGRIISEPFSMLNWRAGEKKKSTFLKSPLEENQQVEIQLLRGGCWMGFTSLRLHDTPAAYWIPLSQPDVKSVRGSQWTGCNFTERSKRGISTWIYSTILSYNLLPETCIHWGKQSGLPKVPPVIPTPCHVLTLMAVRGTRSEL